MHEPLASSPEEHDLAHQRGRRPRPLRRALATASLALACAWTAPAAGCGREHPDASADLGDTVVSLLREQGSLEVRDRLGFATALERRLELLRRIRNDVARREDPDPDELADVDRRIDSLAEGVLALRRAGEDDWRMARQELLTEVRALEVQALHLAGLALPGSTSSAAPESSTGEDGGGAGEGAP